VETWLRKGQSVSIRNSVIDVRTEREGDISGGRLGVAGLQCFVAPHLRDIVRVIARDPCSRWFVISIHSVFIVVGYFSPTIPNREFQNILTDILNIENLDVETTIFIGDFNGRSTVFGDHFSNARGAILNEIMDDIGFKHIFPSKGKYTTFQKNGKGITDLCFANSFISDIITSCEVDEGASVGGSDHRPVKIHLTIKKKPHSLKEFVRWDVRRFGFENIANKYVENIAPLLRKSITEMKKCIEEVKGKTLTYSERVHYIELLNEAVVNAMESAAAISCGIFRYKIDAYDRKFWNDDLLKQEEQIEKQSSILSGTKISDPKYSQAWNDWMTAKRDFKAKRFVRTKKLFDANCEDLAQANNSGKFSKIVSSMCRRENRKANVLDPEKIETHASHFKSTFGKNPTGHINSSETSSFTPFTEMRCDFESIAEYAENNDIVKELIKKYPNGKSAGPDGIFMEFAKMGGDEIVEAITLLFNACRKWQCIPSIWCESNVALIYKGKCDAFDAGNYRPISLTCCLRRIYEKYLISFHMWEIEEILEPQQAGFRKKRSTLEQVYALHELLSRNQSSGSDTVAVFLDIKAAYDSVDRRLLWKDLSEYALDQNFICNLRILFDRNSSRICVGNNASKRVKCSRGLLQGSAISPVLFSLYVNSLIKKLNSIDVGLSIETYKVNNLFYADDCVVFGKSFNEVQELLDICEEWAEEYGLKFAVPKCAVVGKCDDTLCLYKRPLSVVQSYNYLGVAIGINGVQWVPSFEKRIANAKRMVNFLASKGMNAFGWRYSASILAVKIFIRSVIEYGIALGPPAKTIQDMQKVIGEALRRLSSSRFSAPRMALHKTFLIETMDCRALELQSKFRIRLSAPRPSTPAQIIYNLIGRTPSNTGLMKAASLKYLDEMKKVSVSVKAKNEFIQQNRMDFIERKCKTNITGIAASARLSNWKKRWFLDNRITKKASNLITEWRTGFLTYHQKCLKCEGELSRAHAIECSKVDELLRVDFCNEYSEWNAMINRGPDTELFLNYLVNLAMNDWNGKKRRSSIEKISVGIQRIKTMLCGFEIDEFGKWTRTNLPNHFPQSEVTNKRRRERTRAMNRPLGRPRKKIRISTTTIRPRDERNNNDPP